MDDTREKYCLTKEGELYLVYLGYAPTTKLDLSTVTGSFTVKWFNPREGGKLLNGNTRSVKGGKIVDLGTPPSDSNEDWVVIVEKIQK
jgi:hypothetical protein